jgi:UDP-N-acetylmuramoylalanine--D-glutamate ligase
MIEQIQKARNIHVVGISGTEGAAVALFLAQLGVSFTAHDFSTEAKFKRGFLTTHLGLSASQKEKVFAKLWSLREQTHFQAEYLQGIDQADLIFVSQNWAAYSPNHKLQKIYQKTPGKFQTITQLYFQLFPGRILAVTGTNGKSTTTKLIADIMAHSRQKSYFTGNDRRNVQILDCLDKWTKKDWLVVEVSNRQLKFPLGRAPDIGVITNVTKNHLNEYGGSFAKYQSGKYSLISKQGKQQLAVLNQDDLVTKKFSRQVQSTVLPYSTEQKLSHGVYLADDWIMYRDKTVVNVLKLDKLKVSGRHNLSNVLAAVAATRAAGVDWATIRKVISAFKGLPQRLEIVATQRGVRWINDTASTTPESTIAALESFPKESIHLICGGDPKGMGYKNLAKAIKKQRLKSVWLLASPAARELTQLLKGTISQIKTVPDLKTAVAESHKLAAKGESILLSPAAAYFCYFQGKIPLGGRGFELFIRQLK